MVVYIQPVIKKNVRALVPIAEKRFSLEEIFAASTMLEELTRQSYCQIFY